MVKQKNKSCNSSNYGVSIQYIAAIFLLPLLIKQNIKNSRTTNEYGMGYLVTDDAGDFLAAILGI